MQPMGDARKHYWRTLKMAKAMDVPLATALQDAKLTQSDYAEMINRCQKCPNPGQCVDLLAQGLPLAEAPSYCTNREELQALRKVYHDT